MMGTTRWANAGNVARGLAPVMVAMILPKVAATAFPENSRK